MSRNPYTKDELKEYESSVKESGQVMVLLNYYRVLATIDAAALCGMDMERCSVLMEKQHRRKENFILVCWTVGAVLLVWGVIWLGKYLGELTTGG